MVVSIVRGKKGINKTIGEFQCKNLKKTDLLFTKGELVSLSSNGISFCG